LGRPRAAAPATVVGLAQIELATGDSTYISLRVTLAFADGSVRALVPPQLTELALDRASLGTRVIAFADDEWVYDVWPVR
jgi:prepilin-type processing-associated H-X9-DG protein